MGVLKKGNSTNEKLNNQYSRSEPLDVNTKPPKILMCTVDSWITSNASSTSFTLSELFKDYKPENLAALYIREEAADNPVCSRYFRISEQKVLKSLFKKGLVTGVEIQPSVASLNTDNESMQANKAMYAKYGKKRNFFALMARELVWLFGHWKSKELVKFLDDFSPDVVVFGIESYLHFNRINRFIVKHTGAKAIGYLWDDHISYYTSGGLSKKIHRFLQRISVKRTAKYCNKIFSITPKTKQEVDEFLGVDSVIMTKPIAKFVKTWTPYTLGEHINILYTGNLQIGRTDTLKLLGKALKKVNSDGERINVDVYTMTVLDEQTIREFGPYIHLHEPVTQAEVMQLQNEADILLFIEDLSEKHRYDSRLSFSTKLTDYFTSGKCILAIATPDVASMEYLKNENVALCASTEEDIENTLLNILENPEVVIQYGEKAFECGMKNHSREKLVGTVEKIVKELMVIDNENCIGQCRK